MERERRNDSQWSYCHYFFIQEELALIYRLLALYSDALVQYDELDVLFSQYISTFNLSGKCYWYIIVTAVVNFRPVVLLKTNLITPSTFQTGFWHFFRGGPHGDAKKFVYLYHWVGVHRSVTMRNMGPFPGRASP